MRPRILLADDCPSIRKSVTDLLEREGFEIVGEAVDGAEAVTLATALRPDVVILDLDMPVLDGLSAARQIQDVTPDARLILLTVHAEDESIVAAMRCGFLACVAKSDAAEDLARAIREVSRGNTYLSLKPARALQRLLFD